MVYNWEYVKVVCAGIEMKPDQNGIITIEAGTFTDEDIKRMKLELSEKGVPEPKFI